MKKVIKLNESELNRIISKALKECINESFRGEIGLKNLGQDSEQYTALQNAKTMLQNNEEPLKIKQTTGWEIGYDGKWKYEGVDGTIKKVPIEEIEVLGDIWDDEDLYKWYPQLKNTRIKWKDTNDGNFAESSPNLISIPKSIIWWDKANDSTLPINFKKSDAEKTIQHEIQHIIQNFEMWDGGRPAPDLLKYEKIIGDLEKELELVEKYKNITEQECYQLYRSSDKNSLERCFFVNLLGFLRQGYTTNEYMQDLKHQLNNLPSFEKLNQEYYNNNGEREAYEVNNRYGWDYEKRRNALIRK